MSNLACPFCERKLFTEEDDLFSHVKGNHYGEIDKGVYEDPDLQRYRTRLKSQAVQKAYVFCITPVGACASFCNEELTSYSQ